MEGKGKNLEKQNTVERKIDYRREEIRNTRIE